MSCWSRKRRAELAMEVKSSPTLKITTPLIPSGIPWWVTQSMLNSASRRSSVSRRTVCTPGTTSVPLPVTILNPRLSCTLSLGECSRMPEMMRASFGSATRQHALNRTMARTRATPTVARTVISVPPGSLHAGDDHRARGVVLDHHDAAAGSDRLVRIRRVGVERLRAAAHGNHDLAQLSGRDGPRHSADLPDHLLVRHWPSCPPCAPA